MDLTFSRLNTLKKYSVFTILSTVLFFLLIKFQVIEYHVAFLI